MNGIWILLILILTATLPAIIGFIWFKSNKIPVSLPWYLISLVAGAVSLFFAALIQSFFPPPVRSGLGPVFFGIFVRIALVEEASRLVTLVPLLKIGSRLRNDDIVFGSALGLAAGLGFAAIENAFYGTADINITLLRAFTAAPLHGACGIRTGTAVLSFREHPVKAIFLFISAVLIHGAYNLMIVSPALPSIPLIRAAIVILFAIAVLYTSLSYIKTAEGSY